jgi:hypothetical protein
MNKRRLVQPAAALTGMLRRLRRHTRCFWWSNGIHDVDLHSGRCRYCKREWSTLYPPLRRGGAEEPWTVHSLSTLRAILSVAVSVKRRMTRAADIGRRCEAVNFTE